MKTNVMESTKDVEFLKYNLILLKVVALLPIRNSGHFFQFLLQHIWRTILRITIGFTFFTVLINIIYKWDEDFDDCIMNYMYLGCTFYLTVRTNYYCYFDDRTEKLISDIRRVFRYRSQTGFEEIDVSRAMQIIKWTSLTWIGMALFISQSIIITPIVFGGYVKRVLPVSSWYPYNYSVSPYYELTVCLQLLNQLAMSSLECATDMFFAAMSLMMAKQFEILSCEIKNLFYTNLLKWGISMETVIQIRNESIDSFNGNDENVAINNIIYNPTFQSDLLKNLSALIRFHKALLSLSENMENFFSPVILWYFFTIPVVLMSFAYSLITTHNLMVLAQDVWAGTWFVCEVLFLSYFAELIIEKSEDVHTSLYEMPWYLCDKRFMLNFKIIHQRTNVPVTLTVGKFKNLNLNMFIWTLKTVYSVTTLLKNMNQRT